VRECGWVVEWMWKRTGEMDGAAGVKGGGDGRRPYGEGGKRRRGEPIPWRAREFMYRPPARCQGVACRLPKVSRALNPLAEAWNSHQSVTISSNKPKHEVGVDLFSFAAHRGV
jgi:hypothetical protein